MAGIIRASTIYGVSCTDKKIYFFKQKQDQISQFASFNIGQITIQKMFYLPIHKTWLTAGKDLLVHRFQIKSKNSLKLEKPMHLHDDEITTIIEVVSPFQCMVSGGMDKRIVIYSLLRNTVM